MAVVLKMRVQEAYPFEGVASTWHAADFWF